MHASELLRNWIAGDHKSGEQLTARYYESIFWFFRGKVDLEAIEDLVQSTFLAFFIQSKRCCIRQGVRAYLFGIARIKLLEYYRRKSRLADRFESYEHSVADGALDGSLTSLLDAKEDLAKFYLALRALPFDTQLLIELKFYDQFTESELSEIFGTAGGTIRARSNRARRRLREQLTRDRPRGRGDVSESEITEYFSALRDRVREQPDLRSRSSE